MSESRQRKLEALLTKEQIVAARLLSANKFLPKASQLEADALEEARASGGVRLTLGEIAEKAEITPRQLYNWRTYDSNFIEYTNLAASSAFLSHLPDVMNKHLDMMLKGQGSMKGIELFYKFGGLLVDKQEVKTETTDSTQSIEDRLAKLRERSKKREEGEE